MAQLFQTVFGYNIFHDYLANYAGKVVAISAFPQFSNLYLTHKEVVRKYNKLIKRKNIKNKRSDIPTST